MPLLASLNKRFLVSWYQKAPTFVGAFCFAQVLKSVKRLGGLILVLK
jgi:hypothetical protein